MPVSTPAFVSADQARDLLDWPSAVAAMARAYAEPAVPGAFPPRTIAEHEGAWLRGHLGVTVSGRWMGAKLFARSPGRAASFVMVLFDKATGEVTCLLDGSAITSWRTAATSALAVSLLAPDRLHDVAVVGSGLEARTHVAALAALNLVGSVRIFSPTPGNRAAFAAAVRDLGIPARDCPSPEEAITGAGLVVAAARSRDETPTFDHSRVDDRALVLSIGSTLPSQREVAPELVARCDLVVADDVAEVADATGDMIAARREGVDLDARMCSLHDLVTGALAERVEAARMIMYKSAGSAVQDLALAGWLYERARDAGEAVPLPAPFELKPPSGRPAP